VESRPLGTLIVEADQLEREFTALKNDIGITINGRNIWEGLLKLRSRKEERVFKIGEERGRSQAEKENGSNLVPWGSKGNRTTNGGGKVSRWTVHRQKKLIKGSRMELAILKNGDEN